MKNFLILSAIIWAVVILAASYLMKDHENYQTLFGVLLVAAGLHNGIIYNLLKNEKKPS
jgi:glucose-6-phosphate-specific signal transduction histidine kinase